MHLLLLPLPRVFPPRASVLGSRNYHEQAGFFRESINSFLDKVSPDDHIARAFGHGMVQLGMEAMADSTDATGVHLLGLFHRFDWYNDTAAMHEFCSILKDEFCTKTAQRYREAPRPRPRPIPPFVPGEFLPSAVGYSSFLTLCIRSRN